MMQIRAEKTSKNKDDVRVLIAGVVICILMIFGQQTYAVINDAFFEDRPFVSAETLEIVYVDQELEPLIRYDADANQRVNGTWVASVYNESGTRLNTRRGSGNYNANDDTYKYWSWAAWFDNEETDPPAIPDFPFYICVRYVVEANDSGVEDETPLYCSNVYDPANPLIELAEEIVIEDVIK